VCISTSIVSNAILKISVLDLNCRLLVLTSLLAVVTCILSVLNLHLSITTEAQRLGSVLTANNPTNPFGGAYESPPQIIMVYNNIIPNTSEY
jgi:hypothetical protein